MKQFLKDKLKSIYEFNDDYVHIDYSENINEDALTDKWLTNRTSYIYKVSVLTAIDANKCDYVYIAIGVQRHKDSEPELKGTFYFDDGENDDIGRVINRAIELLEFIHPVFHKE